MRQNMVNMFYVTLQFPHCQSVELVYLPYCSARLTAHDRSSSQLVAEIRDHADKHANVCMYVFKFASETHMHLVASRMCKTWGCQLILQN